MAGLSGFAAATDQQTNNVSAEIDWSAGTPVTTTLHDAGLRYSSTANPGFLVLDSVKTPSGAVAAGVQFTDVDGDNYWSRSTASLSATVTGPCFISFAWRAETRALDVPDDSAEDATFYYFWENDDAASLSPKVTIDGERAYAFAGVDLSGCRIDDSPDWTTEYVYVPKGTHRLRWDVSGRAGFRQGSSYDTYEDFTVASRAPMFFLGDITREAYGSQASLGAWASKLGRYGTFVTGDPAKFEKIYARRIALNGADYEARLFHAMSLLAGLAENAQFKSFSAQFGFTVDYMHFTHFYSGEKLKLTSKSPAVNTMVDAAIKSGVPVIRKALADLEAIPDDWAGSVTLAADDWPLDEDVTIDRGDVQYGRASLQAALATLYLLGGYDLTADWAKAKTEITWEPLLATLAAMPALEDDTAWSRVAPCVGGFWFDSWKYWNYDDSDDDGETVDVERPTEGTCTARMARVGSKLVVGVEMSQPFSELRTCYLALTDGSLSVEFPLELGLNENQMADCWFWRGDYEDSDDDDADDFSALVKYTTSGTRACAVIDCSAISKFTSRKWRLAAFDIAGRHVDAETEETLYGWCYEWEPTSPDSLNRRRVQRAWLEQTKLAKTVRNARSLATAKAWTAKALETALLADASVTGRTDNAMHFVEYDPADAEMLAVVRANTGLARMSLDGATTFNLPTLAETFGRLTEAPFSLLPGGGVMDVYLGALFEGRITRSALPKMRLSADGCTVVADWEKLADPTIKGLFPQMGLDNVLNVADHYGARLDAAQVEPLVAGEKVVLDLPQYLGFSVKGLPKGWKWDATQGRLTGTASTAFTLTFSGGGLSERVALTMAAKPKLTVVNDGYNSGIRAVTGGGSFKANTKVRITAAVASGNAFAGWYDDSGNLVSSSASATYTMPARDVTLYAMSVPLDCDYLEVVGQSADDSDDYGSSSGRSLDDLDWEALEDEAEIALSTVGGAPSILYEFFAYSETPYALAASGLPPGVTLTKLATGVYILTGRPTKKGVYRARITGKNTSGFTHALNLRIVVNDAEESLAKQIEICDTEFEEDFADSLGVISRWVEKTVENDNGEEETIWMRTQRRPYTGEAFKQTFTVDGVTTAGRVKSLKVTGLPSGYTARYVASTGQLTISGRTALSGAFKVTVTATCTNKKTAKTQGWFVVSDAGSLYLPVALANGSAGRGTVSGGGVKHTGAKVTFKAVSKKAKTYVFGGWFEDEDCGLEATTLFNSTEWRKASVSFTVTDEVCPMPTYGRFVTRAEDAISFERTGDELSLIDATADDLPTYTVRVNSCSLPTVTASGVPKGMAFKGTTLSVTDLTAVPPGTHTVTFTAKNLSGNTATAKLYVTAPNRTEAVDAGLIDGLDTSEDGYWFETGVKTSLDLVEDLGIEVAKGWTLAVTGLPKGWTYRNGVIGGTASVSGPVTVTFTVKKGKTTRSATATFRLEALPTALVGSYSGCSASEYSSAPDGTLTNVVCDTSGTPFKVSVARTGALTVKYGKDTFTATGFDEWDGDLYYATLKKTTKITRNKKTYSSTQTFDLTFNPNAAWNENAVTGFYWDGTSAATSSGDVAIAPRAVVAQKNAFAKNEDGAYVNEEAGEVAETFAALGTTRMGVFKESSTKYELVCEACFEPTSTTVYDLKAKVSAEGVVTLSGKIGGKKVSGTAVLEVGAKDVSADGSWWRTSLAHFILKPDKSTTILVGLEFDCDSDYGACEPIGWAVIVK